jgi:sec-independent protein translocase protein TatC
MAELTDDRQPAVSRRELLDSEPPDGPPAADETETVMTLVEHLTELRRRIFITLFAVAVGTVVGFFMAPTLLRVLAEQVPGPLYFTQPGGALFLQFKLALLVGVALGSPVLLYQVWAFVVPGLTARERRLAWPWLPLAVLFMLMGLALAYLILPLAVSFLLGFQITGVVEPLITADAYFGFVLMMFVAFALAMQFPIVIVLLSKLGIVSTDRLRRSRRYVLLGLFVLAVVVTPPDPFSALIMASVMYPLYELTIYLVARGERRRAQADG